LTQQAFLSFVAIMPPDLILIVGGAPSDQQSDDQPSDDR
jgi:hypothetical protein